MKASVNGWQSTWSVPGPETRREGAVGRVWSWIACHPWPSRHKQRSRVSIASSISTVPGAAKEGSVLVHRFTTASDCPSVRFLTRLSPTVTVPPTFLQIPLDLSVCPSLGLARLLSLLPPLSLSAPSFKSTLAADSTDFLLHSLGERATFVVFPKLKVADYNTSF